MNKKDITIVVAGAVLLGVGFVGGALFHSLRHHELAGSPQTPVIPAALLAPASTETAPVPEPTPAAAQPTPDKTRTEALLPAVGSKSDGKEVLTDGKEVLAPVSELVSTRPGAIDPGTGGPVTEFGNNKNKLLDPPSQQNVAGPVVSPETR
jgi:hypothetical protein